MPTGILSEPLICLDYVAIVSKEHPLAAIEGRVATDEMMRHIQIVLRDPVTATVGNALLHPAYRQWEVNSIYTVMDAVVQGIGYAWVPQHLLKADVMQQRRLKIIMPQQNTGDSKRFYLNRSGIVVMQMEKR